VAFIAAQLWGAAVAGWLPFGEPGGLLRVALAYALVFIGTLVAWTLMAKLVRMMISATPLTVLDRALGVAFGGQIFDMASVTSKPTAHRKITSATLSSPCWMPLTFAAPVKAFAPEPGAEAHANACEEA